MTSVLTIIIDNKKAPYFYFQFYFKFQTLFIFVLTLIVNPSRIKNNSQLTALNNVDRGVRLQSDQSIRSFRRSISYNYFCVATVLNIEQVNFYLIYN